VFHVQGWRTNSSEPGAKAQLPVAIEAAAVSGRCSSLRSKMLQDTQPIPCEKSLRLKRRSPTLRI
jgi:hypothetical protein